MVAVLIFLGMFTQSINTGMAYQEHNVLPSKTSDLLDTILLNPGLPALWGQSDNTTLSFGLHDDEFSQYKLSSYSSMRLNCSALPAVYYSTSNAYYSNNTAGFGGYLLAPNATVLSYTNASALLGINGTYGFQLSLTPTVTFSIQKTSTGSPLTFQVDVAGTGYPLANAPLSSSLLLVTEDANPYPSYTIVNCQTSTDAAGSAQLIFNGVNGETKAYALVVYSYLDGLKGAGYYVNNPSLFTKTVVPFIESFQNRSITLVHGDSLGPQPEHPVYSQLTYNASFFIRTEEYTLRTVSLAQSTANGSLVYGLMGGQDNATITIPDNDGILIVTYKGNAGQYGVSLMPWGLGSLAFPVTFGGNPDGYSWVATDIRQVTIGGIAYQAKLDLWTLVGGV
jgi:hypothetical protein